MAKRKKRRKRRRTSEFDIGKDILDMSKTVLDVSVGLAVLNTVSGIATNLTKK